MSQKEAAVLAKVSSASISSYEKNNQVPRVDVLKRLAEIYGTSVDYILGMENRRNIFIDDLTENQQETTINIVNCLREGFKKEQN